MVLLREAARGCARRHRETNAVGSPPARTPLDRACACQALRALLVLTMLVTPASCTTPVVVSSGAWDSEIYIAPKRLSTLENGNELGTGCNENTTDRRCSLKSDNGRYNLTMGTDGKARVFDRVGNQIWISSTWDYYVATGPYTLRMDTDNVLKINGRYTYSWAADYVRRLWSSSWRPPKSVGPAKMVLGDDGGVRVIDVLGNILYSKCAPPRPPTCAHVDPPDHHPTPTPQPHLASSATAPRELGGSRVPPQRPIALRASQLSQLRPPVLHRPERQALPQLHLPRRRLLGVPAGGARVGGRQGRRRPPWQTGAHVGRFTR